MKLAKAVGEFFSLDIGTSSIRVIQLSQNSSVQWSLRKFAVVPIPNRLNESASEVDAAKLKELIAQAIQQAGITTKNVVVGIPASQVFITTIEVPNAPHNEMMTTVQYQAENYIPTTLEESKIDWAFLGVSANDQSKADILISSVENKYLERQLELLETGLGLNVIAFEPESIAMTRSILARGTTSNNVLIDMGDLASDLVIMVGENPVLTRSIPFGLQSFINDLARNMNISPEEAKQYLLKYGVSQTALNGDLYRNLHSILTQFVSELNKSIKFIDAKYTDFTIENILLSGYASVMAGLPELLTIATKINAKVATPWQNILVPAELQATVAPQTLNLAVAVGLSEREDH